MPPDRGIPSDARRPVPILGVDLEDGSGSSGFDRNAASPWGAVIGSTPVTFVPGYFISPGTPPPPSPLSRQPTNAINAGVENHHWQAAQGQPQQVLPPVSPSSSASPFATPRASTAAASLATMLVWRDGSDVTAVTVGDASHPDSPPPLPETADLLPPPAPLCTVAPAPALTAAPAPTEAESSSSAAASSAAALLRRWVGQPSTLDREQSEHRDDGDARRRRRLRRGLPPSSFVPNTGLLLLPNAAALLLVFLIMMLYLSTLIKVEFARVDNPGAIYNATDLPFANINTNATSATMAWQTVVVGLFSISVTSPAVNNDTLADSAVAVVETQSMAAFCRARAALLHAERDMLGERDVRTGCAAGYVSTAGLFAFAVAASCTAWVATLAVTSRVAGRGRLACGAVNPRVLFWGAFILDTVAGSLSAYATPGRGFAIATVALSADAALRLLILLLYRAWPRARDTVFKDVIVAAAATGGTPADVEAAAHHRRGPRSPPRHRKPSSSAKRKPPLEQPAGAVAVSAAAASHKAGTEDAGSDVHYGTVEFYEDGCASDGGAGNADVGHDGSRVATPHEFQQLLLLRMRARYAAEAAAVAAAAEVAAAASAAAAAAAAAGMALKVIPPHTIPLHLSLSTAAAASPLERPARATAGAAALRVARFVATCAAAGTAGEPAAALDRAATAANATTTGAPPPPEVPAVVVDQLRRLAAWLEWEHAATVATLPVDGAAAAAASRIAGDAEDDASATATASTALGSADRQRAGGKRKREAKNSGGAVAAVKPADKSDGGLKTEAEAQPQPQQQTGATPKKAKKKRRVEG
ncbi:hypothetical protein HK405_007280 [Cladochytrium tenue]|nr:hypothetical protein HK405_007280 [Cladochytrium tenue]